jgi:MFS family permease
MACFIAGTPVGTGLALVMGGGLYTSVEGMLLNGILPDLGFNAWQLTFIVVGVPGFLLAAIVCSQAEPTRKEIIASPIVGVGTESENIARRWLAFGFIALGFALLSLPLQSLQVWGVQHFVRALAVPLDQASFMVGWPVAIFGTLGALCGGLLTDRVAGRWHDGTLRMGLFAAALYMPFASMVTLVPTAGIAQLVLLPAAFCAMLPFSAATYSIILTSPAGMRSRCLALFSITINLLGVGASPVITAAINDYIVRDEAKIGLSVAIVGFLATAVSFALLSVARPMFNRTVLAASGSK